MAYVTTQPGLTMSQPNLNTVVTQPIVAVGATCKRCSGKWEWYTGIFNCCGTTDEDCCTCFTGTICPCILACQLACRLEEEACCDSCPTLVPGCGGLMAIRSFIRGKYNISGSICGDCCAVTFCCPCVTCQMVREVSYHTSTTQRR